MSATSRSSDALDEERARAEIYGVLARLWHAPPDESLLRALQTASTDAPVAGAFLEAPWRQLVTVSRDIDEASVRAEYDDLFGGIGKPEIYLFGSYHLSGFLNDKPLVQLRYDLARLGLGRTDTGYETEDHIACLFEVMRHLVEEDGASVDGLARQQGFFSKHIRPWLPVLCDAVSRHPQARFYVAVAGLSRAYGEVETQAFDMLD